MKETKEQYNAITHEKGPCLVIAPPGSGKTFIIIERILYLIEHYNCNPERILVITYTKMAALEMKNRFCNSLTYSDRSPQICTFHSLFFKILQKTYQYTFHNIITSQEKITYLKICLNESSDTSYSNYFNEENLLKILSVIENNKVNQIMNKRISSVLLEHNEFLKLEERYQLECETHQKIDFTDMMVRCYQLLRDNVEERLYWQERFCFLLIDEFQDIDPLQFEIVKNLLSKDKNIMVVGDDDQSIYRFRGADPSVMLNFSQDFPTLKQICLRDNFRSCPEILKDSNRLISKNKNRFKKEIIAFRKEEIGKVELKLFLSSYDEADFLIKRIKENYKPNEFDTIAVIFRTHFTAHLFTEMCYKMKLPFCAIEKITSYYKQPIISDFVTFFRCIIAATIKRNDFLKIMNKPSRYLSRRGLELDIDPFTSLKKYYSRNSKLLNVIKDLEKDFKFMRQLSPYAVISYIRKKIGYDNYINSYCIDHTILQHEIQEILFEFECISKTHICLNKWVDEIDYYEQCLIEQNRNMQKELTKKKNAINVMTMHSSKGQEFKTVFVIGVSNNVIPYFKAKTLEEIEEERRLLYVAMTRAKDHLIITGLYKNRETKIEVSPFLQEIYDSSSINSSYSELSKNSSKAADTASNSSSLSIYSNTGSASTSVSSSK